MTIPRPAPARLEELGDGLFAYIQPTGSWGWSNAGLMAASDTSLLVDTLFDPRQTREMLDAMRAVTSSRPIDAVVNSHGDGDHCFGNALMPQTARIYGSERTVEHLRAAPPSLAAQMQRMDFGPELAPYVEKLMGPFQFDDLELRLPTETFEGRLDLTVGGRAVELIEVGPAHTAGDTIVHVPDAGVAFTGDILFVEGTPVTWSGSTSNWLEACDRLLALGAHTFVPGHGPVTDADGVRAVAHYLRFVRDEATARHAAGMSAEEAAADIELGEFADLGDPERIAVTVESVYRELEPERPMADRLELIGRMARWEAARQSPR